MRRIVRNRIFVYSIVATAVLFAVGVAVPRDLLFDLLNPVSVALAVGTLIAFWPGIKGLLTRPREEISERGGLLVYFVTLLSLYVVLRHSYNWRWRYLGEPDDFMDTLFVAFTIYITILANIGALAAEGTVDGRIPPERQRLIGLIVAGGLSLGAVVFTIFRHS